VVPSATANYLLSRQTEEEEVLLARLCCHLNRRAVACADRQCAVHHELHVACPTGFIACRRDLVGNVTSGNEVLCKRDAVLGQKYDLEPTAYCGVGVDGCSQIVDEFNNHFREPICRRDLAGEKERAWVQIEPRVLAQPVVEHNDPQCIQELAFVLVDAFDLAIEDRLRINGLPCRQGEPFTEFPLGISFGFAEVIPETIVLGNALSLVNSLKSRIQASPIASVMSPESPRLHNCSQRRGVTPFVLLLKRSGKISARSLSVVSRNSLE